MTMAKDALEAHFAESRCEIAGQQFTSVASPLTRAISRNLNIVDLLEENPAEGDQILAALVSETHSELDLVTGEFNYIVAGAEPEFTTPMQYGGHFLELDGVCACLDMLESLTYDLVNLGNFRLENSDGISDRWLLGSSSNG